MKPIYFVASIATILTSQFAFAHGFTMADLSCKAGNGVTLAALPGSNPGTEFPVVTSFGFLTRKAYAQFAFAGHSEYQPYDIRVNIAMDQPVYGDVEQYSLKLKADLHSSELQSMQGTLESDQGLLTKVVCSARLGQAKQ